MENPFSEVGGFELLGELKRGGMGVVYHAIDRSRGVKAAVKMVRVADKQFIQSIRREIHALVRVRHPGVVGILAEGVHDGMPWYAMEFVEAATLFDFCRTSTTSRPFFARSMATPVEALLDDMEDLDEGATNLNNRTSALGVGAHGEAPVGQEVPTQTHTLTEGDLEVVLSLVRRICAPLAYIHGEGLVHLDLKPDNVLIRESGMPVILDFGLATEVRNRLGRETVGSMALGAGTVNYMAPEQIKGELVDARTDTYALGCILYELLTGRIPFPGKSPAETIFGHLNLKPARPSLLVGGIPPAVDDLVMRMLEKDPRDRIGYAQDVDRALERFGAKGWARPLPPAHSYVYRPRLSGRGAELDRLMQAFHKARSGATQVVLLSGESGIGKTRLVSEFAQSTMAEAETDVYTGEFHPQGGPLHGFRQILQGIADVCRAMSEQECAQILGRRAATLVRYEPEFQWFIKDGDKDSGGDADGSGQPTSELLPDAARQLLFQDFLSVLRALAERSPTLLILDDLQWADDLSMGFVEYVRSQAEAAPLRALMVATVRTGEASRALDELCTRPGVTTMSIGRLEPDAVGALIGDMLALPTVSSEVVEGLYRHSEGNPLFLTEYLLEAVAEELIWRDADGVWHAKGGATQELDYAQLPLPSTVHDLIVHRIDGLSKDARRLADLSSVLGAEPDLDVLQRAAAIPDADFFDALDELRRRHVLDQKAPRLLAFGHSKMREVTYSRLPELRRARLHGLVAETLVALPEDHPARSAATIAEHFYAAGDEAEALPHALAAGDQARAQYGHDEAERFYLRAIKTLDLINDGEGAAKTRMKLGLVHMAAFEPEKARQVYDQAFRFWEKRRALNPGALKTAELSVATGEPMGLDPGRTYDTDSAFLQRQLFACLVEVDEESNVLPAVASRWQVSQDGKVYTFYLRPDARWSDGTPLVAKHFEFAWRRNLSPKLASPAAALLDVIANARAYRLGRGFPEDVGVRAKSSHELEVRLATPIGYLLQLLAHPIAAPLPSWLVESRGDVWASPACIVTNGAFKVVRWEHGKLFEMEHNRYDAVWSRGNVGKLKCRIFHDYREALRAYQDGEIEMLDMAQADAKLIEKLRHEHGDELVSVPIQSTSYLVFRADRRPFNDARVRRALAHAIDRDRLAAAVRKVGAQPATGGFVPPGVAGHSPDLMLRYQPEQARELLAAAGCSASDLASAVWLHTHGIADPVILEVLCDSWLRTFGVKIAPRMARWKEFQQQVDTGVPDLVISTWTADYADPDNFLRTVFHGGIGLNEPKWRSSEFDILVDSAASRTDQAGRMNFYRAADRVLVVDEAVIVPLSYGREPVLVKPWVRSFPRSASWWRHLKNCWIERFPRSSTALA